jgi:hypothetical protein
MVSKAITNDLLFKVQIVEAVFLLQSRIFFFLVFDAFQYVYIAMRSLFLARKTRVFTLYFCFCHKIFSSLGQANVAFFLILFNAHPPPISIETK